MRPIHALHEPRASPGTGCADGDVVSTERRDAIGSDEISTALDQLLSDDRLHMSERNRRFLRFVVEETLAGREARIKSYTIAVDVFGRAPTFDSISDPIVRIEAVRLRGALADYYAQDGVKADTRIDLPKGGYVPHFYRWREPQQSGHAEAKSPDDADAPGETPGRSGGRKSLHPAVSVSRKQLAGLAIGGLIFAGLFWLLPSQNGSSRDVPVLAIESVATAEEQAEGRAVADGLTLSIVSSLSRFPGLKLVHVREGRASGTREPVQAELDYILTSNLRVTDGSLRFWWSILNARTSETVWSETFDQSTVGNLPYKLEDRIAARVASRVAEPYGIVGSDISAQFKSNAIGYRCVLQARALFVSPDGSRQKRVRACLERTVAFEPDYADAWAALALAYLYEERPWRMSGIRDENLPHMALAAGERAVQLDPRSGFSQLALLASHFRLGDFAASDHAAKKALQLNPNDPEILYAVGIRTYVRGDREGGLSYIERSQELSGRVRPGAQFVLALDAYRSHQFEKAHQLLQGMDRGQIPLMDVLCAASHAKAGQQAAAMRDLEELLRQRPDYGLQMRTDLSLLHFDPELSDLLIDGARTAGLTVR